MLDDRKSAILRAVVEQYIETAEPVGSTRVAESMGVGVSSATVRSEMTTLETEGYLTQPHTSAGRIPTEKGYRFFVDGLGGPGQLRPAQVQEVSSFFSHTHGELEAMLRDTSKLLSTLTASTAMVVGEPSGELATIRSAQLVGLGDHTSLLVLVLSTGVVLKRSVDHLGTVNDDQLARASTTLAAALVDKPIDTVLEATPTGDAKVDTVVQAALGAAGSIAEDEGPKLFVDGASNMAAAFDASSTLQHVLELLEQQMTVVALMEDVLSRGLSVAIGSETGVHSLSECAVVVAPIEVGGDHAGTVGVLGPTRMNYSETLAAVADVSQRLSRMLTEG
jgi:heat-inducible transcriptional repressor